MEKLNRSFHRRILLVAIAALAIGSPCNLSAQSAAEKALLAKAQSLASHGRLDMAVQTGSRCFSDPNSTEALAGIAKADMQLASPRRRQYLDRLRSAGGSPSVIAQIQSMPHLGPQSERLSEASRLAQNGQYAEAMRIYRDVFGPEPPAGNDAVAYYDTEAAIPANRPHAIAGLRKLAKKFPGDPRYAITLGRVLTYDPKTRSEGIAILNQYGGVPDAQAALKQALSWNAQAATATVKSEPGYEVSPKPTAPAGNPLEASAYRALNSGRLDEAERQFQEILDKQPNNPRALAVWVMST